MTLFVLQLVLNTLWSVIFFYYRRPGWAFLELVILWAAIGVYTLGAWSVSRISFILFLPYWAWVTFAGVLNYSIWRMNLDK
jgi:tryptophan-rich sensory protein